MGMGVLLLCKAIQVQRPAEHGRDLERSAESVLGPKGVRGSVLCPLDLARCMRPKKYSKWRLVDLNRT